MRTVISIVVMSVAVAVAAPSAQAATSPSTTTATPTKSPLLRAGDIPAKYTSVSQPATSTSTSPRYPTVDANCVINPQVPFSGLVPKSSILTWATDNTGSTGGSESVYVFSDVTTAKALYKNVADTYVALTKCPVAKQTIPASSSTPARTVDIGSWATLAIPTVGEEQTAIALTPSTANTNTSRIALWRDGGTVVVLNLRDKTQPKGVFNKLVTTAEKRIAGS